MTKSKPVAKQPETVEEARAEVVRAQAELTAAKQGMVGKQQRDDMARTTPEFKRLMAADKAVRAAERNLGRLAKATKRDAETQECQVCERRQKTRDGKLVHHGYARPGWGHIVGDCYGAGYAPFPAHDRLDAWLTRVEERLVEMREALADLPEVMEVRRSEKDYSKPLTRTRYATKIVVYKRPETRVERPAGEWGQTPEWKTWGENVRAWEEFETKLSYEIRDVERAIKDAEAEAERVRARIQKARSAK